MRDFEKAESTSNDGKTEDFRSVLAVSGLGIATYALVALFVVYLFAAHNLMFWEIRAAGIVPVGPVLFGAAASIGYLVGTRLMHVPVAKWLRLQIMLVALLAHAAILFGEYLAFPLEDGRRVADVFDCWAYLSFYGQMLYIQATGAPVVFSPDHVLMGYGLIALQYLFLLIGTIPVVEEYGPWPWGRVSRRGR